MREQRAFREVTEALRRVRNSRSEKSGVRRHDHRATSVNSSICSEAEYEMVEDEEAFVEAPWRQEQTGQTFFELEIWRYQLLQNARLSRRATDCLGGNWKRHVVHSNRDTIAQCLGRPRPP